MAYLSHIGAKLVWHMEYGAERGERARASERGKPPSHRRNGRNYYEISTYTFTLDACDLVTLAYAIMAFIIYISLNNRHDLKWSEKEATLQIPHKHTHTHARALGP